MPKKHQDTTVSLHPLKFDDAITKLTLATKQHAPQRDALESVQEPVS